MEELIQAWKSPPFDEATQKEVARLENEDPQGLHEAFGKPLEFGTAGIRGVMGVGPSQINVYTISIATQGLASYLLEAFPLDPITVCIGYDSRNNSKLFAETAAKVLAGNGIHSIITKDCRPTPFVSFCCKETGSKAAIMITASHNPPQYNGYKVYWSDGAQIVPPHDEGIIEAVNKADITNIKHSDDTSFITYTDDALEEKYIEALKVQSLRKEQDKTDGKNLSIAYTPLHGVGGTLVPRALASWGFTNLTPVESQIKPDGNFPTTKSPNPEDRSALDEGIKTLESIDGDILIATDPDSDRVGLVVKHLGKFETISGNQIAAIILDYLLETKKEQGTLERKHAVVASIVSTRLLQAMCAVYHVDYFDVLTGFKYVGQKIHEWEVENTYSFLFGAEESYGYLVGTHARDKDAVVASCLLSEIALHEKRKGRTLIDTLHYMYEKYGIFYETQRQVKFPASNDSMDKMKALIDGLRKKPLEEIQGNKRIRYIDYKEEGTGLPPSNMLEYVFENNARILIRPSGTEPKIKIYGQIRAAKKSSIVETIAAQAKELEDILEEITKTYFFSG